MTTDQTPTAEAPETKTLAPIPQQDFQIANKSGDELGFTINRDGTVTIAEDQTPQQYVQGLQFFKWGQTQFKLAFSDYVKKGKAKHGNERVNAGLQQLEFPDMEVQTALDIATIPDDMRHPNLNADHYIVLAKADLSPAGRRKWSKIANEQKLTPNELKRSIVAGEVSSGGSGGSGGGGSSGNSGIMNIHGIRMEFDIWLRRVKGEKGILAMKPEEREEIKRELAPFAKLYLALNTEPAAAKPAKAKKAAKKPAKAKK